MKKRKENTTSLGSIWSKETILEVWEKGKVKRGKDKKKIRSDKFGDEIHFNLYGKRKIFGWEIDHSKPVAKGGTDHINNLQPLYWQTNVQKGDFYPYTKDKHIKSKRKKF